MLLAQTLLVKTPTSPTILWTLDRTKKVVPWCIVHSKRHALNNAGTVKKSNPYLLAEYTHTAPKKWYLESKKIEYLAAIQPICTCSQEDKKLHCATIYSLCFLWASDCYKIQRDNLNGQKLDGWPWRCASFMQSQVSHVHYKRLAWLQVYCTCKSWCLPLTLLITWLINMQLPHLT